MTAGQIIDQARDKHSAFHRQRHPNKGALRFLSGYARQLHGKITAIDATLVQVATTVTLPLVDILAGIALPTTVRSVEQVLANYAQSTGIFREPHPVRVIDMQQAYVPNAPVYSAWQIGTTLFLRPPAGIWTPQFQSVTIWYVLLPGDLETLDDILPVPDASEQSCVAAVALFFAEREAQEAESKISLKLFEKRAGEAHQSYLDELGNAVAGMSFFTSDVYRP